MKWRNFCANGLMGLTLAFLFLIPTSAVAGTITITLDNVSVSGCGETWIESGVELSFVNTTDEDCAEDCCFFGTDTDGVWLYPARLSLDLSGLTDTVTDAEVDIIDYCGVGCTAAFLYEGASTLNSVFNTKIGNIETLYLWNQGASVDRIAVSSCEGFVGEIRLTLQEQPRCEGDFDEDGDVDGSDLALFAADFGRTDCDSDPECEGDFDYDDDVDGSDLAIFAADFGRTDCP